MKSYVLYPQPILCNVLRELCAIRNNNSTCDVADISDIIALIENTCLNRPLHSYFSVVLFCLSYLCYMFFVLVKYVYKLHYQKYLIYANKEIYICVASLQKGPHVAKIKK